MRLHIKNGRLIDPANHIDAQHDVFIADGRIASITQAPSGFVADQIIDASGLIVCPGLVDLSARLREPGYEYKATLESELQSALAGGVTSLLCPPDTDPVLDEPGLVEMLVHRARILNQSHVYPLGALTVGLKGSELTEMAELTEAGCIGFSQAEQTIENSTVLMRAMQYAQTFGYTVWLRPQDPLHRATVGFESAIKFMDATDNTHLLPEFWQRTQVLDALRNEELLQVIPELGDLK
jgi:dihydroorotase